MMIRNYKKGDMLKIHPQEKQKMEHFKCLGNEHMFSSMDTVKTVFEEGIIYSIYGFVRSEKHRGYVWMMNSKMSKGRMITLYRIFQKAVDNMRVRRLEMTVDSEFKEACKMSEMLGFKKEGLMKKFTSDGRDYFLFARVD